MLKCVAIVCLMALSVMGQEGEPRPDRRAQPGPPSGPSPPGQAGQPPRQAQLQPGNQQEPRAEMEEKEPCPPTTGREWICRMDWWNNTEGKIVDHKDVQPCDSRDFCYLGPIVSRPLNEPWIRKFMCGPRPCEWSGTINGESQEGQNACQRGTCTLGPFSIWLNGTSEVSAKFCNVSDDDMEEAADIEEMMEPQFAKPVCEAHTPDGVMKVKDCENHEMCMRAVAPKYHEGAQYRVFMCTNTPSMMQKQYSSKIEEIFSKMHHALMDAAEELVMNGNFFYKGPQKTISKLGSQMQDLKSHLMFAEKQAKEKKEDKMELPKYMNDLMDNFHVTLVTLHNQVVDDMGGMKGNKVMEPIRKAADYMQTVVSGEPSLDDMVNYVHEGLEWMMMHVQAGDLRSDMAKASYRSLKEIMMHTYQMTKMLDGDSKPVLAVMEEMAMAMQTMWNIMTEGPVMEGETAQSVGQKLVYFFKKIGQELQMMMSAEDRMHKIWESMEKLKKYAGEGRMMSPEAFETFKSMKMMKLQPMMEFIQSLPNQARIAPILKNFVMDTMSVYNHMSGGLTPMGSSSETAIQRMMDGASQMMPLIKEGEMMLRGRGAPAPTPAGRAPGQEQERRMGDDNDMDDMDMGDNLRRFQESMADLDRRVRDQERGDNGRLEGGMQARGGDLRGELDEMRRHMTDMLMTMVREKGYGEKGCEKGDGEKGYGEKGNGDMGYEEKGNGDKGYGEKGMGDMMGDMMGGMRQMDDMMGGMRQMGDRMGDMGDREEECEEPLFWRQISREDRDKWSIPEDAFMGPENVDHEDQ